MKRRFNILIVGTLLLISSGLWVLSVRLSVDPKEVLVPGGALIVIGYGLYLGVLKIKSLKRKEPLDDEFSKKVMIKSSSLSFYISLYMWLFIMYLSDKTNKEASDLIGSGIIGMAIIFMLSWVGTKFYGMKDE
ncbi:MAG TPA: hypothetical protein PLP69_00825 [Bacteroidales bacterium]|nr:hypothetical protein [Bacteroidales bacterium]HPT11139.1 hypothetical protein [Bacteroidales bacterium]